MSITATELKANLGKYITLAQTEDIYITQYGKVVAKLTSPYAEKLKIVQSLIGALPGDMTVEEAIDERTSKI